MFLIVGLGNPGAEYEFTRHNAGFMLVDRLAATAGVRFGKDGRKSRAAVWAECAVGGGAAILAKPMTYMNLSGRAVQELLVRFGLGPDSLLVVIDDCDLPLGRIRVRKSGTSGGHRGLESIIGVLGTVEFARMRLGVGRKGSSGLRDYVLGEFGEDEKAGLDEMLARAEEAVKTVLVDGVDAAMNRYNPS